MLCRHVRYLCIYAACFSLLSEAGTSHCILIDCACVWCTLHLYHKTIFIAENYKAMYILRTISRLYPDLVFNPDMLTAALQEYCPLSDDCRECSVRDLVVTEPEVFASPMVMFFVVVRFPSGPVHTTSGITVSPLTTVTCMSSQTLSSPL